MSNGITYYFFLPTFSTRPPMAPLTSSINTCIYLCSFIYFSCTRDLYANDTHCTIVGYATYNLCAPRVCTFDVVCIRVSIWIHENNWPLNECWARNGMGSSVIRSTVDRVHGRCCHRRRYCAHNDVTTMTTVRQILVSSRLSRQPWPLVMEGLYYLVDACHHTMHYKT